MKNNMGIIDRTVRIMLAIAIFVLLFKGGLPVIWSVMLGILAVTFILTSTMGWCPAYLPFHITTCKKDSKGEYEQF
jgi:hypothetical protein